MENHTDVEKKPIYKKKWFLISVGIIILINLIPKSNSDDNNQVKQSNSDKKLNKSDVDKSISTTNKSIMSVSQLKDTLNKTILSIEEIKEDYFVGLKGNELNIGLDKINSWVSVIKLCEFSNDKEVIRISKKLSKKIIDLQIKSFPIMRKTYSDYIENEWNRGRKWMYYINVSLTDNIGSNIKFSDGQLYNKDTVNKLHYQQYDMLKKLRFKKTEYWGKSSKEGYFFSIESPLDKELI
jgi:hypothetical protein